MLPTAPWLPRPPQRALPPTVRSPRRAAHARRSRLSPPRRALLAAGAPVRRARPTPPRSGSVGVPHCGVLVGGRWARAGGARSEAPPQRRASLRLAPFVRVAQAGASVPTRARARRSSSAISAPRGGARHAPRLAPDGPRRRSPALPRDARRPACGEPRLSPVGDDGLAWDEEGQRFLRLDVAREWLLVKALVEDPRRASSGSSSTGASRRSCSPGALRAASRRRRSAGRRIMLQPPNSGLHDDHVHVLGLHGREVLAGCVPSGPSALARLPCPTPRPRTPRSRASSSSRSSRRRPAR